MHNLSSFFLISRILYPQLLSQGLLS
jgi:hypothetical protein